MRYWIETNRALCNAHFSISIDAIFQQVQLWWKWFFACILIVWSFGVCEGVFCVVFVVKYVMFFSLFEKGNALEMYQYSFFDKCIRIPLEALKKTFQISCDGFRIQRICGSRVQEMSILEFKVNVQELKEV